jgi:serine/threonine protein kinase
VNVGKEKELRALKRINKFSIDNPKSIEHVKNEKTVLKLLVNKDSRQQLDFIVQLYETFTDEQSVCFLFEYLSGQDLFWVVQNEHNLFLGKTKNGGRR